MKTLPKTLTLAALTIALGGIAYAQADQRGWGDPDANKTVTRAEAQTKADAMFAKLDVNKDGKLDQADRAAHMGQKFDAIDTDHNGAISRDEFMAGHKGHDGMSGQGGKMDHGGMDGMHKMGGRGEHEGRMAGMMLRMADTNKDGVVTHDEFTAAALKHFDMADANHDGKLTPEERKAAHAKMRDMMGKHGKRGMHDMNGMGPMGDMPPPPPSGA